MAKYRRRLPMLGGGPFLTDGGIETTLIFHEGLSLPHFAAFHLLRSEEGTQALRGYYRRHASIARKSGVGFVLESATWRASADWGALLGYSARELEQANRRAIELLHELRREFETDRSPMVISGAVGPRGDGYRLDAPMSSQQAQAYHADQIRTFAEADADLATAITMTNSSEAIGVVRAAQAVGLPVVIAFTVETDGRLPTGEDLADAIRAVDRETGAGPAYYMISCAHPTHFAGALVAGEAWVERIRGLRANASKRSHAELDEATALDVGDPLELGEQYRELRSRFGRINVLGGCCGTDHRHIERISERCLPFQPEPA
jgi:S-methylmethionine-dependent homocysteine/selenocysteine methylase